MYMCIYIYIYTYTTTDVNVHIHNLAVETAPRPQICRSASLSLPGVSLSGDGVLVDVGSLRRSDSRPRRPLKQADT